MIVYIPLAGMPGKYARVIRHPRMLQIAFGEMEEQGFRADHREEVTYEDNPEAFEVARGLELLHDMFGNIQTSLAVDDSTA